MSQFETGHAKNVANLLKLNQLIATFGGTYNPGNATITSAALATLHTNATTTLTAVNTTYNTWKNATNNREIAFVPLDKFATQLLAALQSTSAPQQTIDDFAYLAKQIRGEGKLTKADAGLVQKPTVPGQNQVPEDDKSISTSHQSYDSKIQHFTKMILLLQSVPSYTPNEPAMQIAALQTQLTNITNLNNLANTSYANLKAARIARNLTFYANDTGMLDRIRRAKAYIRSIYGAASQQYKAANDIKFTRVVSKKNAK